MTEANILIVEDDKLWQEIYQRSLRKSGYQITVTGQFGNAKTLLNDNSYDVVITDLKMLGEREEFSGFNILKQAISSDPNIQVIVITGYGSADHALQAMGNGAYDYITKDQKLTKKLPLTVRGALETRALKLEWASGKHDDDVELTSDRIIGNSSSMEELYRHVAFASESDINVLLFGESGTGKRLIAQTIHLRSNRKEYPFLVIDCGRLSESVLAGELFGYESGTLFGIEKARPGKFERANG
ncbi:MAG: sigma-54-dependent Fis family transcriptional regulator, partial [Bdellovibrionales bacterium]|nr:sigma-54-dependent Fis family transcriptional regulator [Bdellovibrionales bacterium]